MIKKLFVLSVLFACGASRKINGVKPAARARPFWDPDFCFEFPDVARFVHENCDQFWECDSENNMIEMWCPEGEIFDEQSAVCGENC